LALPVDEIRTRAERIVDQLRTRVTAPNTFGLEEVSSAPGGGALPELSIPSVAIAITSGSADHVARQLRSGEPAVFGRVQEGRVLLDLRTVMAEDDKPLLDRILECMVA